jgi:hypothetical protein
MIPFAARPIILRSEYLLPPPAARGGRSKVAVLWRNPIQAKHAAHEPVALGHGEKAVECPAIDQAEIARVTRRRNVAEPPREAIEEVGRRALEPAFALTGGALGGDDGVALHPFGDHLQDDLGRVLQIPVHHDDRPASGMIEPDGDRDLVAEIAR